MGCTFGDCNRIDIDFHEVRLNKSVSRGIIGGGGISGEEGINRCRPFSLTAMDMLRVAGVGQCLNKIRGHAFTFLSETWVTKEKHKSCFVGKQSFVVHARKPTGRGRPSGGLELYITKRFEPTLLSSSPHHIAVDAQGFTIIGVYYQPTTDYDDLVSDLTSILKKVKNPEKVIIGGDFNIRPDSSEFSELAKILSQWRITLRSDPGVPTHTYSRSASVLDHIFTSENLSSTASYVRRLAVSDHLPISVTFKMPRNFHHLGVTRKGRCLVNVQKCAAQLEALLK